MSKIEYTGMVIFPVQYIEDDNYLKAYIVARDLSGALVAMYIHPNEKDVQRSKSDPSATFPSIEVFGDTDLRYAKNPCFCSEDNSKHNPNGILLCEQVEKGKMKNIQHNGQNIEVQAYRCKWASVLRSDSNEPTPAIGLGYMEVGFKYARDPVDPRSFPSIQNKIKEWNEINGNQTINPLDKSSILQRKFEEINSQRDMIFASVILKHRQIIEDFVPQDGNHLRYILEQLTGPLCTDSRYGIVLIRVREGNVILTKHCSKYETGYNYSQGRFATPDENWQGFMKYKMKYLRNFINNPKYSIDLIPAQRINCSKHGHSMWKGKFFPTSKGETLLPASKEMKLFIDKRFHFDPNVIYEHKNAYLASWLGVRVAKIRKGSSKGNEITSTAHAFSGVFGNVLQVTPDLSHKYQLDYLPRDKSNSNDYQQAGNQ